MEVSTIIFISILVIFVLAVIYCFNKLVKALNLHREAFSNVDVALKKRFDLIPNLEETVKGYAAHEQELLTEIAEIREKLQNNLSVGKRQKVEDKLSGIIKEAMIRVESYPELKASQNFMELQRGLAEVEADIEQARSFYNGTTRTYNILVQSFPSNILAKLFGFKQAEYFEVDLLTRENVTINFTNQEENNTDLNNEN